MIEDDGENERAKGTRPTNRRNEPARVATGHGPRDTPIVTADVRRAIRRLAAKKAPIEAQPEPQTITYERTLPRPESRSAPARANVAFHIPLEEAVAGVEERVTDVGSAFVVTAAAPAIEEGEIVSERFRGQMLDLDSPLHQRLSPLTEPVTATCDDVVFMDVESTGFGNAALFLIGVMVWENDAFVVRQFFARDYAEERTVVAMFQRLLASHRLLVTFNGKSFDFPYIRARAAANGVPLSDPQYHLDLLHVCRRIWKEKLPNCRLQTLEAHVCGRTRLADLPSSLIPDAYHDYVRTQNAWQMAGVLKHNLLDLVTLADLMCRFPPVGAEDEQ